MGVHDKNRYGEIKEALGIPDDEPIFIIRGKDKLAPSIIDLYDVVYMSTANLAGITEADAIVFSDGVHEIYDEVRAYQKEHPELVKVPD